MFEDLGIDLCSIEFSWSSCFPLHDFEVKFVKPLFVALVDHVSVNFCDSHTYFFFYGFLFFIFERERGGELFFILIT